MAEISSSPKDENELIRIRVVDLLVVGGFRIGEVLTLPVNCWVEKPQYADDGSQLVDAETGAPVVSYGLRYWPEKGQNHRLNGFLVILSRWRKERLMI